MLRRAIGDLKYKQSRHLSRPEQIISGDPDVSVTALLPDDKFFLIACDGIWDCFTNQEAVSPLSIYVVYVSAGRHSEVTLLNVISRLRTHCASRVTQVDFVRTRLEAGKDISTILEDVGEVQYLSMLPLLTYLCLCWCRYGYVSCSQMFDFCVSVDPRTTGGIGGDNMTCIIVQLNL